MHTPPQVELYGKVAHAMGDYIFTDATSGDKVRAEPITQSPVPNPKPNLTYPDPNPSSHH